MLVDPLRVLNLFTIMNRGGAETAVMNYYRRIDRDRLQFDFLVHRDEPGAYDQEIRALGGRIFVAPRMTLTSLHTYRSFVERFFLAHPEFRLVHSHMSELGYLALRAAHEADVPVRICHAHNRPHGIDRKSAARFVLKHACRSHITHHFACSLDSGAWLFGSRHMASLHLMKNAIDASAFAYDDLKRTTMRSSLGVTDEFIVGHVGRFERQKNHSFILQTFKEILIRHPRSKLVLVGDGPGRDQSEQHAKRLGVSDHVLFLGVREDISELLLAMDVFVFPSLFEGLPVSLVEAQASGLTCFISDRISSDAVTTDHVQFVPLALGPEHWASRVLSARNVNDRSSTSIDSVSEGGFDVAVQALELEKFYMTVIRSAALHKDIDSIKATGEGVGGGKVQ